MSKYDSTASAEVMNTVPEDAPDTIATPEGDNEYPATEPILNPPDITRPRGDEPHPSQPIRPALP